MREEQGNKDLTLRDAVVKFLSDDPSKDRIFRRIKKSYEARGECCSNGDTRLMCRDRPPSFVGFSFCRQDRARGDINPTPLAGSPLPKC